MQTRVCTTGSEHVHNRCQVRTYYDAYEINVAIQDTPSSYLFACRIYVFLFPYIYVEGIREWYSDIETDFYVNQDYYKIETTNVTYVIASSCTKRFSDCRDVSLTGRSFENLTTICFSAWQNKLVELSTLTSIVTLYQNSIYSLAPNLSTLAGTVSWIECKRRLN